MSAMLKRCAVTAMAGAVLLLAGCTQSAKPSASDQSEGAAAKPAAPAAPPEPVAAKTAFWPMYTAARSWATDLVTLTVSAKEVPGFKNADGKAAMWQATFGSPSLHQYRVYSYSIATVQPDIYKGVTAGLEQTWAGETRNQMAIDTSIFNVDSDAAYQAAAASAADWLKTNPEKTLSTIDLGQTFKIPGPAWYLVWGSNKSGYAVFVDANSGKVLKGK